MPAVNRRYPLRALLDACRTLYPLHREGQRVPSPRQKLTFEYVLLAGENDSAEDANRLARLVTGIRCKVNLIPFNPFQGSPYRRPDDETVLRFPSVLRRAGLDAFVRKSKGRDVLGACGQLGTPSLISPRRSGAAATLTLAESGG